MNNALAPVANKQSNNVERRGSKSQRKKRSFFFHVSVGYLCTKHYIGMNDEHYIEMSLLCKEK